jgi:2-polyprenyl-6-methoxyphenol hydroxylase-like FAD-dependent oxidoreductase
MKALVVGGGIGGLSAAIGLRRAGIDVVVFERARELHEVGAGISLWANALHALDALGVGEAIRAASVPDVPGALRASDGSILSSPSAGMDTSPLSCVVMHRADLLDILVAALGREHIRLDARCVGVYHDGSGVTLELADGSVADGDVLIGADGLRSVVRAALHGDQPPDYSGYTAWRAVVSFESPELRSGESWGAGARFGMVRIGRGRVYWYATQNAPEGEQTADEKGTLLGRLRDWHAPIPALIAATDPAAILRNDIYDRPALKTWSAGRVTLLGDAAHPMTPNLGQGGCQAIEDAVVLARVLGGTPDVAAALRTYEVQRIPRTTRVATQSRQIGRIGQWEHPWAVAARNAVFRRISARLQMKQLEAVVGYRV